eukprot:11160855-Lingulodinium_polyedra.AAC.1
MDPIEANAPHTPAALARAPRPKGKYPSILDLVMQHPWMEYLAKDNDEDEEEGDAPEAKVVDEPAPKGQLAWVSAVDIAS